jgi:hypothetical protein
MSTKKKKAREKQDSFHDLKKERSFNDWAVKHVLLTAASHHRGVSFVSVCLCVCCVFH